MFFYFLFFGPAIGLFFMLFSAFHSIQLYNDDRHTGWRHLMSGIVLHLLHSTSLLSSTLLPPFQTHFQSQSFSSNKDDDKEQGKERWWKSGWNSNCWPTRHMASVWPPDQNHGEGGIQTADHLDTWLGCWPLDNDAPHCIGCFLVEPQFRTGKRRHWIMTQFQLEGWDCSGLKQK